MNDHKQRKHGAPGERIKCDQCDYEAITRWAIALRKRCIHGAPCEPFKCDQAIKTHVSCRMFKCMTCVADFSTTQQSDLEEHYVRVHHMTETAAKEIGNCNVCKLHDVDS